MDVTIGLTEADDRFHPHDPTDVAWVETVWFSWIVPESRLVGYVYLIFRPVLATCEGGALVYDDTGELPWELPSFEFGDPLPLDTDTDLTDATFANGVSIRCVDPGERYVVRFDGAALTVDLEYQAMTRPLVSRSSDQRYGHIDQYGTVTGTMTLAGKTSVVDCAAMRDRGWGPRVYRSETRYGYAYAADANGDCFLAVTSHRDGTDRVVKGFLQQDGMWAPLSEGQRDVVRDVSGRPQRVTVIATDSVGREVHASGDVFSRHVFTPYRRLLTWDSLIHWRWGGHEGWGEDQDVWHIDAWRQARARTR